MLPKLGLFFGFATLVSRICGTLHYADVLLRGRLDTIQTSMLFISLKPADGEGTSFCLWVRLGAIVTPLAIDRT